MKSIFIRMSLAGLLLCLLIAQILFAQTTLESENQKDKTHPFVDQMAEYPGGLDAMNKFITENLKYPEKAKQNKIKGTVILNFVVNPQGELGKLKVAGGIGHGCDEEAVRVLSMMPKWKPGKHDGKIVEVNYTLPILFSLD
ncbi:MAG: energy transducer TonB [Saprospiraceae bacterium]|nr:energy transducer TonB [Saprospiraceae bacterium]